MAGKLDKETFLMKNLLGLGLLVLVALAVIGATFSNNKGGPGTSDDGHITLVQAQSACAATGVDDVYTGDGKVLFSFTLRNTGETSSVTVTPVRHYSDGETNRSAMDTMDVTVAANSTERFKSPMLTYEAHAHEIVSCGLRIDGNDELPIEAAHL